MSSIKLIGHERPIAWLRSALAKGRLAHAFLFVGPEGIGKRQAARFVAQGLLCETRPNERLDPCGACAGCVQVAGDSHPDFFTVARPEEKNVLPIESIQELCRNLTLKPARGRRKIAVVDDADSLSVESANRFLKTLEEPPDRSVLILLATNVESQLPTIVSRSQIVRFSPLSNEQVAELLVASDAAPSKAAALELARWSAGSVGAACELAQTEWATIRERVRDGLAKLPEGCVELTEELRQFVEDAGKDAAAKRSRARQVIRLAADVYRDTLLHQHVDSGAKHIDPSLKRERSPIAASNSGTRETDDPRVLSLAERLDAQSLLDGLERCLDADHHIIRFLNQTLALDCFFDDLAQIADGQYVPSVTR